MRTAIGMAFRLAMAATFLACPAFCSNSDPNPNPESNQQPSLSTPVLVSTQEDSLDEEPFQIIEFDSDDVPSASSVGELPTLNGEEESTYLGETICVFDIDDEVEDFKILDEKASKGADPNDVPIEVASPQLSVPQDDLNKSKNEGKCTNPDAYEESKEPAQGNETPVDTVSSDPVPVSSPTVPNQIFKEDDETAKLCSTDTSLQIKSKELTGPPSIPTETLMAELGSDEESGSDFTDDSEAASPDDLNARKEPQGSENEPNEPLETATDDMEAPLESKSGTCFSFYSR